MVGFLSFHNAVDTYDDTVLVTEAIGFEPANGYQQFNLMEAELIFIRVFVKINNSSASENLS